MQQETESTPTVIVVDDEAAVRKSLRFLLQAVDLHVETYSSAEQFLEQSVPDRPGCVLLDMRMPGMSGLELQKLMPQKGWLTPVIFITGHADVEMAVRATKAGALEFIEKPFDTHKLLDHIWQAIEIDHQNRRNRRAHSELKARLSLLTSREREVLEKVVVGMSSKQIAADLRISIKTVEKHRAKVMKKTQAGSLAELVKVVLLNSADHAEAEGFP